jgi:hypothetical protein
MESKTVTKIVDNLRANGLMYFAIIAIIYMIYNVVMTASTPLDGYCSSCSGHGEDCDCEDCQKEHFSDYTGDKDNVGFISTNVKKCNQPVFKYGIPGVATKQRVPYL